jgi:transcriptional regulator with XRE-family HTH domain
MTPKHAQFGKFLAQHRKAAGLTLQAVADAIGVTKANVYQWEAGNWLPEPALLEPLAQAIDSSYEELFTRAGYDPKSLPKPEPYLRTLYPNASARNLNEAKRLFERLDAAERRKKGKRS